MKSILTLFIFVPLIAATSGIHAGTMFSFSGVSNNGTGSAIMDVVGNGTSQFIVTLENTSPILTTTGNDNAPGITGFGFEVDQSTAPMITSWSLWAKTDTSADVLIGGIPLAGENDWIINNFIAGVTLDYLPTTSGSNIQGALYNPLATSGLAALPNYFTTAVLTLNFNSAASLTPGKTFIRMQNVGGGGGGSLKLWGSPYTPPPPPGPVPSAPEPGALAIFLGVACCLIPTWRQR